MEQTIGKRIVQNRKRLGLTQDQLAEQLGVTAQAVSKWENDQSCPDITMLPRLAEIFGTTTDDLLGRPAQAVHQAEVVTEEESDALHVKKGQWDIKIESARRGALSFAILVLLVGGLTLTSRVLDWDVSMWEILWPSALMIWGISGLFEKMSFFRIGCALFGTYYLLTNLHIWNLEVSSDLVFPVVVILSGLSLLVDALRKPKKRQVHISHNGKRVTDGKNQHQYSVDDGHIECSLAFGEHAQYVALPRLAGGEISCSFGELTVDLQGCDTVSDDCELEASCSFGELTLLVPSRYRVDPESSTAFASFATEGCPDAVPCGIIHLESNASFGQITVKYV